MYVKKESDNKNGKHKQQLSSVAIESEKEWEKMEKKLLGKLKKLPTYKLKLSATPKPFQCKISQLKNYVM